MSKKKLKIGVDIDGTLVEFGPICVKYINKVCDKNFKYSDWTSYCIEDSFGISTEQKTEVFKKMFDDKVIVNLPFKVGAKSAMRYLNTIADIFIVTYGGFVRRKYMTEEWLEREGIKYHTLHSVKQTQKKVDLAKHYKFDYYAEDDYAVAKQISELGTKVFLMKSPYGQDVENNDNLIVVESWDTIVAIMKLLDKDI